MAPNGTVFEWSTKAERAAVLVAHDEQPDHAIAAACKISKRTLERWKAAPEFAARVAEHREVWRAKIEAEGIANRQNRVAAQNDRWRRMLAVIEARAADPNMANVPGGSTGLLAHDVKGVGKGDDFQLIDVYAVDTGLLKELREHEKLTAEELGQRTERRMVTPDLKLLRKEAEELAAELGIPVEQVLREAGIDAAGAG